MREKNKQDGIVCSMPSKPDDAANRVDFRGSTWGTRGNTYGRVHDVEHDLSEHINTEIRSYQTVFYGTSGL